MKIKRAMLPLATAATFLSIAGAAQAAPGPLQCFSGQQDGVAPGTCVDRRSTFELNTVDGNDNPNDAYAGVYQTGSVNAGKRLRQVSELRFSYSGGPLYGGSPRFSLAIDTDGAGSYEYFAFIDAIGCSDGERASGQTTSGTVDPINDPTCNVEANGVVYPSWAAFVASTPRTARIATDDQQLSFIIADQPGRFTLSNISFGLSSVKPGTVPK